MIGYHNRGTVSIGNEHSLSDEIGLLPLFLTLILPIVIGIIVVLHCVYNHCCIRKQSTKSYTVKPTLKSWRGTSDETAETHDNVAVDVSRNFPEIQSGINQPNFLVHTSTNSPSVPVPSTGDVVEPDVFVPVPPRRIGSTQWRRQQPPIIPQNSTNDNQVNFSGDSQDSRGYTRISVREPLSNIRDQVEGRISDPHYTTVSDDSEEVYAAIEDGDENYMRIPEDEARHWQEHREANSPLPPVPPPISPVLNTDVGLVGPTDSIQAPIYAQVAKSKKSKNPAIISHSSESFSAVNSSSHVVAGSSNEPNSVTPFNTSSMKKRPQPQHTSITMETSNGNQDTAERRWSKADINYSEFEVIRESPFSNSTCTKPVELLDEDNYNLIPEVRRKSSRLSSKNIDNTSNALASSTSSLRSSIRNSTDTHHPYSEISKPSSTVQRKHTYAELRNLRTSDDQSSTTKSQDPHLYSELTKRPPASPSVSKSTSGSGYYQEIGDRKPKKSDNLYQKIKRKGVQGEDSEEDDEDEEDQFYEKVKIRPTTIPKASELSDHTNPNSLKHGYEKIKPKKSTGDVGKRTKSPSVASKTPSSIESDEDASSLYEQVKYPPYERLKQSQESILDEAMEDEEAPHDNLYEDIGYGCSNHNIKTPNKSNQSPSTEITQVPSIIPSIVPSHPSTSSVDPGNLYARVDMTKKKRASKLITPS